MTSAKPVVLILGAGENIGHNVGSYFAGNGYRVAYVARRLHDDFSKPNEISIRCDLSKPDAAADVFQKVKKHLGVPTVVVYNAYSVKSNGKDGPLGISLEDFNTSVQVNTTSMLAAAKAAVKEWDTLGSPASATFLYTGNGFTEKPFRGTMDLGVGKAASANLIALLADEYKAKGYKFYFVDERMPDGDLAWFCQDGPAHAEFFHELSKAPEQRPWNQTFVKGKGYTFFENANITDGAWARKGV